MLMPPLIVLLTFLGVAFLVPVWKRHYWRPRGRIYYTLLVLAAIAFTWFLAFWKLLAIG
jgi:hypothetical protein